jgi:ATP-dependent protease Clp ATPase subunit
MNVIRTQEIRNLLEEKPAKENETMAFRKAERTQLYLRCALFGPSGSGKTMTALRMAKGIAGKMGVPFAVIDTESKSASKYSDRFTFDVENLETKTVEHYIAAMNEAAKAGYKVLVIDSLSHAWRELTEEVDRIAEKSVGKNSFSP